MSQKQVDTKPLHSLADKIKSAVGLIVPAIACVGVGMYLSSLSSSEIAINASVDGVSCGYVSSYSDMQNAASRLESTIYSATDGAYTPNFDITFNLVHTKAPEYLSGDDCYELLWERVESDFSEGYMLYIDEEQVAAHENGDELEALIGNIEFELMAKKSEVFDSVKLKNDIRVEKQICLNSMFRSIDEINLMINPITGVTSGNAQSQEDVTSDVTKQIGAVSAAAPGITDSLTAVYSEARFAEIPAANSALLEYNYVNTITLSESIPFEITYVDDPYLYIGTEKFLEVGADGEKEVTYEILYDSNGAIVERIPLSECVTKQPVDRVISRGTKAVPAAIPTGKFIWPCETPVGVSSGYGWRTINGYTEFHLGIDLPNVTGSPIFAADGGVVVFADHTPSYGNNIRVAHANGYSTVYAHLDEIRVSVGDKVFKGQQIGTMGSTGLSYGTHLHFEVRINQLTIDPLEVLPD